MALEGPSLFDLVELALSLLAVPVAPAAIAWLPLAASWLTPLLLF